MCDTKGRCISYKGEAYVIHMGDVCERILWQRYSQKGLEVSYCFWGCHPDPRLGPVLGPSRSHSGSEGVPSRFAMCFDFQHFRPIQVPRWGPSPPVLVPSCSRAFLPGSGLDGPKQTSRPLPIQYRIQVADAFSYFPKYHKHGS